jgi:hypothetical protein
MLLLFDAIAAQRGDGLHPILRERLLGLAGNDVPREPMRVADSTREERKPLPQRRRLVVIDRGS